MTLKEKKTLLTNFCNQVRDALLERADRWPEEWDGHELRELVARAFEYERTALMREKRGAGRRRRLDAANEILVRDLY